jgi:predicted Zn-dependent peptidase
VEKEKGIIGQEIRMYEDNPDWRVFFNYLDALFQNHPVKKDIAGTIESISKINKETLYTCYNTFYHPANMIVFIVGDVDPEWVFKAIGDSQKIKEKIPQIKRNYPQESEKVNKPYVEQKMHVSQDLFMLGFKGKPNEIQEDRNRYIAGIKILLEMIAGKSSSLYEDLYQSGLITSNFDADYTSEANYSYSAIGGESKSPQEVKGKVVKAVEDIRKNGLSQEDFERVKKMRLGNTIKAFNSIENIAHNFLSNYFKGINFLEFVETYNKITFEDIKEIFNQHFDIENLAMSVIKPKV